jgi:hypothetical protein
VTKSRYSTTFGELRGARAEWRADREEVVDDAELENDSTPVPPTRRARMTGMRKVGRNDPCACGCGRKVKRCCGVQRGPDEDSTARAFLAEVSRDAAGVLNVSESQFIAMMEQWSGLTV